MALLDQVTSWLINGLILFGGIAAAVLGLLYVNQDKMLYIPCPSGFPKEPHENPEGFMSPNEWTRAGKRRSHALVTSGADTRGIPFEERFIETEDKRKIHTWLLLQDNSAYVPTLVLNFYALRRCFNSIHIIIRYISMEMLRIWDFDLKMLL